MLARETGLCLKLLHSLARRAEELTPISELAAELELSRPYAAKLCHRLRNAGYLEARQGVRGGVALSDAARSATLYDLACDLSDPFVTTHCILLRESCSEDAPCPLHETWGGLHATTMEAFRACPITGPGASGWTPPPGAPPRS